MENKTNKRISQSWQQYSANMRTTVMVSQIPLPLQLGFRNFGIAVSLAKKDFSLSAGSCGKVSLRLVPSGASSRRSCDGGRYQSFPGNTQTQLHLCSL